MNNSLPSIKPISPWTKCCAFILDCAIIFVSKYIILGLTLAFLNFTNLTVFFFKDMKNVDEHMVANFEISAACLIWIVFVAFYFIFLPSRQGTIGMKVFKITKDKKRIT